MEQLKHQIWNFIIVGKLIKLEVSILKLFLVKYCQNKAFWCCFISIYCFKRFFFSWTVLLFYENALCQYEIYGGVGKGAVRR